MQKIILSVLLVLVTTLTALAVITPGADRLPQYLPQLKGKRVALLINQTSRVGNQNLLDVLRAKGVNVVRIFVPEHGFRGTADAGAHVASGTDAQTGLPVISLYGANKKPKADDLNDVDVVVYDLQDVGVRFYTYISSLEYVMESCAENGKQLLVLDRPNPNGFYVDGPVLEPPYKSFVGMQPVPIVYGMTVGEYAKMLVGERWVKGSGKVSLTVIPCTGYDHTMTYELPVPPSPNLRTAAAVLLYPSLCLFEGTVVSVGRGTDKPFEQFGHPDFKAKEGDAVEANYTTFIPTPGAGATKPLYSGQKCYGLDLVGNPKGIFTGIRKNGLRLGSLIYAYQRYGRKDSFFNAFFEKLAGTGTLCKQVTQGLTEVQIQESWKPALGVFKTIRKKYLLYPDFE